MAKSNKAATYGQLLVLFTWRGRVSSGAFASFMRVSAACPPSEILIAQLFPLVLPTAFFVRHSPIITAVVALFLIPSSFLLLWLLCPCDTFGF